MSAAENIINAVSYLMIALVVCPWILTLPAPRWLTVTMTASGLAFFTGCGLHHADLALHAGQQSQIDLDSLHMLIFNGMQSVGALTFAVLGTYTATKYVSVSLERRPRKTVVEAEATEGVA